MVFISFLEWKGFVHDSSGGKEVKWDCEEERNHHETLPYSHASGRDGGYHQSIYGSYFRERLKEKIATHTHQQICDDFGNMDTIEDFGQSAFGGIFEVED